VTSGTDRGFTLVEMLVILVLIAVSVALVYPSILNTKERFDGLLATSAHDVKMKRESFARFIDDGLPPRKKPD
jgi:prepilin-type N-terminal cleavage/methylation domain-containing protein